MRIYICLRVLRAANNCLLLLEDAMKITYNPLWKLLIDKGIKKGELCKLAGVSPATITKMGNGAHINTDTIVKICSALHCGITDIIELVED